MCVTVILFFDYFKSCSRKVIQKSWSEWLALSLPLIELFFKGFYYVLWVHQVYSSDIDDSTNFSGAIWHFGKALYQQDFFLISLTEFLRKDILALKRFLSQVVITIIAP